MTNHPNRGRPARPLALLNDASNDYPDAWKQIETFRSGKGKDLPGWPDWCFLPMAAWYSIVSAELQVDRIALPMIPDVARLAALGAWRYTQGIYKLDTELFSAVSVTVPSGSLPTDVLYHLPEWSLYIDTPGLKWMESEMYGFFAHLEHDVNTGRGELRLLIDCAAKLMSISLHLGNWTITEAIDRFMAEAKKQAVAAGVDFDPAPVLIEAMSKDIYPLISLLLYVCSKGVDYPDNNRPQKAKPKRTKRGWKLFPADKPRIWLLGEKIGNNIRNAGLTENTGSKKSAHIRRAHWHGYWTGPRDTNQEFELKWIPPTVVAAIE